MSRRFLTVSWLSAWLFIFSSSTASGAPQEGPASDRLRTIRSLEKLDDFPLYVLRFFGDYDLPDPGSGTAHGSATPGGNGLRNGFSWACTCFSAPTLHSVSDWSCHNCLTSTTG